MKAENKITTKKVLIGGSILGALLLATKMSAGKSVSNNSDNTDSTPTPSPTPKGSLKIATLTLFDSVFGLIKSQGAIIKDTLRIVLKESIRNSSGYDVTINDLNVVIQGSQNGTSWNTLGKSAKIPSMKIGSGKTSTGKINVDFGKNSFSDLTNSNTKYRTIVSYTYNGENKKSISNLALSSSILISSLNIFNGVGCACSEML